MIAVETPWMPEIRRGHVYRNSYSGAYTTSFVPVLPDEVREWLVENVTGDVKATLANGDAEASHARQIFRMDVDCLSEEEQLALSQARADYDSADAEELQARADALRNFEGLNVPIVIHFADEAEAALFKLRWY